MGKAAEHYIFLIHLHQTTITILQCREKQTPHPIHFTSLPSLFCTKQHSPYRDGHVISWFSWFLWSVVGFVPGFSWGIKVGSFFWSFFCIFYFVFVCKFYLFFFHFRPFAFVRAVEIVLKYAATWLVYSISFCAVIG